MRRGSLAIRETSDIPISWVLLVLGHCESMAVLSRDKALICGDIGSLVAN